MTSRRRKTTNSISDSTRPVLPPGSLTNYMHVSRDQFLEICVRITKVALSRTPRASRAGRGRTYMFPLFFSVSRHPLERDSSDPSVADYYNWETAPRCSHLRYLKAINPFVPIIADIEGQRRNIRWA